MDHLWPPTGARSVVVRILATRDARLVLCAQVRRLLSRGDIDVVTCDCSDAVADLEAVDALARLQLTARRLGGRIRLRAAPADLAELIDFVGVPTAARTS
jgi:ABC-type transporter Mla MlaB component